MTRETKRGRESDEEGRGVREFQKTKEKEMSETTDGRETENRWKKTDKWQRKQGVGQKRSE